MLLLWKLKMAKHNVDGHIAELAAKIFLTFKGYSIIRGNYKQQYKGFGVGEIDVIAVKKNTLVFMEVKKRAKISAALEAISNNQRQRIIKGAEAFLKLNPSFANYNIRFDVFAFVNFFTFTHIKDAWRT